MLILQNDKKIALYYMTMNKKIITSILIGLSLLTFSFASAQITGNTNTSPITGNPSSGNNGNTGATIITIPNPLGDISLKEFVYKIVDVLIIFATIAASLFFLWSGFLYVSARGDASQIKKAHQTLWWTIVGAALILGAKVLALLIENTLGAIIS